MGMVRVANVLPVMNANYRVDEERKPGSEEEKTS